MTDFQQITDLSPETKYVPKDNPGVKDCDFIYKSGQRKLFVSELYFLTKYGSLSDTVIYAGASPGTHINSLIPLFPNIKKWILYDPDEIKVSPSNNVIIINDYFTVDEAKKYVDEKALFISDIRSYKSKNVGKVPIQKANSTIKRDMELQKQIVMHGNYAMSTLKFRLPWDKGQTEYFNGNLFLTPWLGEYSPELRLITDGSQSKIYDHAKLDNQMYHYNSIIRRQVYELPFQHTYQDQMLELSFVQEYIAQTHDLNNEALEAACREFIHKNCEIFKESPTRR